jgi:hypothetical protein
MIKRAYKVAGREEENDKVKGEAKNIIWFYKD